MARPYGLRLAALLCLVAAYIRIGRAEGDACENRPATSVVLVSVGRETTIVGTSALFGPELPRESPGLGARLGAAEPADACSPLTVREALANLSLQGQIA